MKKKIKALRFAVVLALLLGTFLSVTDSFAYWNDITVTPDTAIGTVTTGTWTQIYEWSATSTYTVGDIVTWNGSTWISTKSGTNTKEPSLSRPGSLWWDPYTP